MPHREGFPADRALAGECSRLLDGDEAVFLESNHTINLRIEVIGLFHPCTITHLSLYLQWPGYDGWGAQVSTGLPR